MFVCIAMFNYFALSFMLESSFFSVHWSLPQVCELYQRKERKAWTAKLSFKSCFYFYQPVSEEDEPDEGEPDGEEEEEESDEPKDSIPKPMR